MTTLNLRCGNVSAAMAMNAANKIGRLVVAFYGVNIV